MNLVRGIVRKRRKRSTWILGDGPRIELNSHMSLVPTPSQNAAAACRGKTRDSYLARLLSEVRKGPASCLLAVFVFVGSGVVVVDTHHDQ